MSVYPELRCRVESKVDRLSNGYWRCQLFFDGELVQVRDLFHGPVEANEWADHFLDILLSTPVSNPCVEADLP